MNNDNLNQLRLEHPELIYESALYSFNDGDLSCHFKFRLTSRSSQDTVFTPKLIFHNLESDIFTKLNKSLLQSWVFNIGLVELLSYWKAACPPKVTVKAGFLSSQQLVFWQELLKNGLSEFFYLNQINGWQENFVQFKIEHSPVPVAPDLSAHLERYLLPMGGGKDSLVSFELLKRFLPSSDDQALDKKSLNNEITLFMLSPTSSTQKLLQKIESSSKLYVTRVLDPQLAQLNSLGYLNGHTPFSALLAFVSCFAAWIFDHKYVVLSNEQSANEGNIEWLGHQINHQYSKSYEFELLFRDYIDANLSKTIEYFSLLRPWYELKIAQEFSRLPQYFTLFLSCNKGKSSGVWCGNCPKCLFVFSMLSAFLPPATLVKIFGQNLFENETLRSILDELTGVSPCKSFECVGLREETQAALYLTQSQYQNQSMPILLKYAAEKILPLHNNLDDLVATHLAPATAHHSLPLQLSDFFTKK